MASTNPLDPDYDPYNIPNDQGLLVRDVRDVDQFPAAPVVPVVETPAVAAVPTPTGLPGSPLNTEWGVDSESYLTDDQKKLARQIQGKFDASLNTRDRQLAQYGAPKLSSFVEDEALARAMSLAQGLNYREPVNPVTGQPIRNPGGVGGGGGGGSPYRPPTNPYVPKDPADPSGAATNSQWSRILSGLASIAPLLFGKDAYGNFLNKGLIGWASEKLFGPGANVSPEALERIVSGGGATNGPITYNPITGQPMMIDQNWTPGGLGDPYGPGSGWGDDTLQTPPYVPWEPEAGWDESLWTDNGGWEGGDWGGYDWWDFSGGSGGDYVDLFGGV